MPHPARKQQAPHAPDHGHIDAVEHAERVNMRRPIHAASHAGATSLPSTFPNSGARPPAKTVPRRLSPVKRADGMLTGVSATASADALGDTLQREDDDGSTVPVIDGDDGTRRDGEPSLRMDRAEKADGLRLQRGGVPTPPVVRTPTQSQVLVVSSSGGADLVGSSGAVGADEVASSVDRSNVGADSELSRPTTRAYAGFPGTPELTEVLDANAFGKRITDDYLRERTGFNDLSVVVSTELRLNSKEMLGIESLSSRLPRIESLKLNGSAIPQLRLLGTRYSCLKRLWLANAHLKDVSGIGACASGLEELYLPFNAIQDITPLLDLSESLQVLDLEANMVSDVHIVCRVVPALHKLTSLSLVGNPFMFSEELLSALSSTAPSTCASTSPLTPFSAPGDTKVERRNDGGLTSAAMRSPIRVYRAWIMGVLPSLSYLDDTPLHGSDQDSLTGGDLGEASREALSTVGGGPLGGTSPSRATNLSLTSFRTPYGAAGTTGSRRGRDSHVYVDPMDEALAAELLLVQECIRESSFDDLDAAVEEHHRSVYSRPSTACDGTRSLRLNSAAASELASGTLLTSRLESSYSERGGGGGGGATPSWGTSHPELAHGSKPLSGRLSQGRYSGDSAQLRSALSVLTSGGVLAGNATASLRRRLAPLPPTVSSTTPIPGEDAQRSDGGLQEMSKVEPHEEVGGSGNRTSGQEEDTEGGLFDDDMDEWREYNAAQLKQTALHVNKSPDGLNGAFDNGHRESGPAAVAGGATADADGADRLGLSSPSFPQNGADDRMQAAEFSVTTSADGSLTLDELAASRLRRRGPVTEVQSEWKQLVLGDVALRRSQAARAAKESPKTLDADGW